MKPKITYHKGFWIDGRYIPPHTELFFPNTVIPFGLRSKISVKQFTSPSDEDYSFNPPSVDEIVEVIREYLEKNLEVEEYEGT